MARRCVLLCILILFLSVVSVVTNEDQQVYIVYMGSLPSQPDYLPMSDHMSILQEVMGSSIKGRLVRSYKRSFNGFAARLTEAERERVSKMKGVVSVFPNKKLQLQTTSSWDFMGLKEGKETNRNPTMESDTIVGVIDTGIWSESDSFSDIGFGPLPLKWKGVCSGGNNFTCNNKVIGVRDYTKGDGMDFDGHGTHTTSTVAGNSVPNISFYGLAKGTVRGGVPSSRIAVYKACTKDGCNSEAIVAAFDDAIADGVDIISISIGGEIAYLYNVDPIAIGAFHAMAKGVLTVNSAGNSGPDAASIASVAPWIFTVAASNTNRGFFTKVVLGNGKTIVGKSVNTFDLKGKQYPLVYGKSVPSKSCSTELAKDCLAECVDESFVKGKILLCRGGVNGLKVAKAKGAVAAIVTSYRSDFALISPLPASSLTLDDFNSLVSYIESSDSPQATVLRTEAIYNQTAPRSASFSSRGPNTIAADLLKPDISAPGVEILAAYSPEASIVDGDTRRVKYSVLSGTSMACPHVAGVAAYVKTFNPKWSPSMIKSAIMTTAWPMNANETGFTSTEFANGAGHVNPIAAVNPGLVYDLTKTDHISFLCSLNYTASNLKLIAGETVTCGEKTLTRNLNYPSMAAKIPQSNSSFTVNFIRTVTNVGTPNSTYKSNVVLNLRSKINVEVSPSVLSFMTVNEKKSFMVTVSGSEIGPEVVASANLIWSDDIHNVKSPIVVYTYETKISSYNHY